MRYIRLFGMLGVAALLGACGGTPASTPFSPNANHAVVPNPLPAVCTVPRVKSGQLVTSVSAFGNVKAGTFALAQPSSWIEVRWLKYLPPGAKPATTASNYLYYGTYTVSDGTTGCLYVTTSKSGKPIVKGANATLAAMPRIPDRGVTLPVDSGRVGTLTLRLKRDGTGTGKMTLVHFDGTPFATGKLTLAGRVDSN